MEETKSSEKDRRRGWVTSFAIHAVLLLLALLPFLSYEDPPPGQQGVLVSFGAPDMGSGDDSPDTQQKEYVEPEPPAEEAAAEEEVVEEVEEVVEEVADETVEETDIEEAEEPEETPPIQELPEEVVTTDEPDEVAIQKQKEEEAREKEEEARQEAEAREEARKAEEARKKAQAEAEAQKKAEAEAKARAEAEAQKEAEYEAAKKQFGDVFGSGKGKTDKPGNQGDPDGDPDARKLEGVSTGSGMVGGGLGDRGVVFIPKIQDSSQKTGVVVVRVCVDKNGDVSEPPRFTQKGSTTADSELVNIAISSAKKFRFSKSSIDKQCGTITVNFKVQ